MDVERAKAELSIAIERACRAHDDAGRTGEDRFPYEQRISDLRVELALLERQ